MIKVSSIISGFSAALVALSVQAADPASHDADKAHMDAKKAPVEKKAEEKKAEESKQH